MVERRLEEQPESVQGLPLDDVDRLQALAATELLDSLPEEQFDRLTRIAVKVVGAPVALVSLVDDHRQFFKSAVGLPEPWASRRETPLSHSFCQHVVTSGEPLVVEDAREHALVRDNKAIPDLGVIAYAGVPIVTEDGYPVGSFCAIDGQPRRWSDVEVAALRDLGALMVTEISLRRQSEQRAEAIGTVAHDLRNPLGICQALSDMLLANELGRLDESQRELLEIICDSSRSMLRMCDELLDITRIDAGRLRLSLAPTDLVEFVQREVELASVLAKRKGVVFDVAVPDDALVAPVDGPRFKQVLDNLLSNATKFSPPHSTVDVALRVEQDEAVMSVRDHGSGIAADEIGLLFKPFGRASSVTTAGEPSIGLGLAIAQKITAAHGGRIWAESEVGEGATFLVALPLSGAP